MTITIIPQHRVVPGKLGAAIELFAEGKHLALKHGASDVHVRRFVVGGQIAGVHQAMISFDSMSAYGDYAASINADPAFQQFVARITAADSPLPGISMLQTSTLARFGSDVFGDVALVRRWQVQPGRMDEFLSLVEEVVRASNEPNLHVAVSRINLGGELSGQVVTAGALNSMASLGAYMDRLEHDAELLRLQAQAFGSDSPARLLGMAISVEVPV